MQFLDKFRKKNQDEAPPPRRRAPRRGSTAGLLQPEDEIAADSKARRYDKRAVPRVSDIVTKSLSTSMALAEGLNVSLPGVTSITKRASDGGATTPTPLKRISSLTPVMFRGTSPRGVSLETEPDERWSNVLEDEDFLGASRDFSIDDGAFQKNENEMKGTRSSFQISEFTAETSQGQEASFAPQFDPQSAEFDSSSPSPDKFADFGHAAPFEATTAKSNSPILVFESFPEAAPFADFQENDKSMNETGASSHIPATTTKSSQAQEVSFTPQFDSQESAGFDLGPDTFTDFDHITPRRLTTAQAPSPILASESSPKGVDFADFDSNATSNAKHVAITSELEASQQQQQSMAFVDLESSAAAGPMFATYQHSSADLFSYSEGPESFVQFDPNSSEPRVITVADS